MKIKWKNIYYPLGEWRNEENEKVSMPRNFRCSLDGVALICVCVTACGGGGHGDPGLSAPIPFFIDAETLDFVDVKEFVEIIAN